MKNALTILSILYLFQLTLVAQQPIENKRWCLTSNQNLCFKFLNDTLYQDEGSGYEAVSLYSIYFNLTDTILIQDIDNSPCNEALGVYWAKVKNDTLQFFALDDSCAVRRLFLDGALFFHKISTATPLNLSQDNKMTCLPNPIAEQCIITMENTIQNIQLIDISGKNVTPQSLQIINNQAIIDVSNFDKGAYLIQVLNTNQKIQTLTIIKN